MYIVPIAWVGSSRYPWTAAHGYIPLRHSQDSLEGKSNKATGAGARQLAATLFARQPLSKAALHT
jgi:hypothetical protein